MNNDLEAIKRLAKNLVAGSKPPVFYSVHAEECTIAENFFDSDPVILQLKAFVAREIENDFGHGLSHSIKVALDAGALVIIECRIANYTEAQTKRLILLVQCAGLLHDIKRKQKNHAVKSAEFAYDVLQEFALEASEIDDICLAIRNHEAFKDITGHFSKDGRIISNCLYDADKFRWGPDNFAHTVWEMVSFSKIPLSLFVSHFPKGMKIIDRIKKTFRSSTGRKFGPEFINIGITIGNKLYKIMTEKEETL